LQWTLQKLQKIILPVARKPCNFKQLAKQLIMKISKLLLSFVFMLVIAGCQKSLVGKKNANSSSPLTLNAFDSSSFSEHEIDSILVDASKDGGVWWFPQAYPSFSDSADHQGKALADYLRSLGHHVDELPRGAVITDELLNNYSKIIRAAPFFEYSDEELAAYKKFLNKHGAILLFQDHLSYDVNDKLSEFLGVSFKGAVSGVITNFANHEITKNIVPLPFFAGAVATNTENNPDITVLGSIGKGDYTVLNGADPFNGQVPDIDPPVMGLVTSFPNTKIFFIGDMNGMENVPQPLTQNIVNWLFK
jgi:hypothetical protein